MKNLLNRKTLYTFLVGLSVGVAGLAVTVMIMFLNGSLQNLLAAGVGTGAPDVNARYLDGYGTSLSAAASKIYVSDGSNYLPDNTVDAGAIVDGTVASADIADGTIANADISSTAGIAASKIADGAGSGLDADKLDGADSASYKWPSDISCGTGFVNMGTYCIQTNEANGGTGLTWFAASDYCHDNYGGAHLCSTSEWYNACINGNLTNGTDDYEWVDDWNDNDYAMVFGNGSCGAVYSSLAAIGSHAFRCCK